MVEYAVIIVLLCVIFIMVWVWYIQPKRIAQKSEIAQPNLKDEFDIKYHTLIDAIEKYAYSYDASKLLLTHIQMLTEKQTLLELAASDHEKEHHKVSKGLDQKSNEIVNISHQMRTSLSGLLGFTQFLESTEMTEEQKEFVEIIASSSDELLILVNSIIDMTPAPLKETRGKLQEEIQVALKNEIPYVLVVDDNDINKKLLAKVLERENLKVTYASNGEEAVSLRKENQFDLIFMDIQMPIMNGVDASKAIRKFEDEEKIAAVPIIALTANTGKDDRDSYLDAGMTDYMAKPIMIDEVRKRIAQLQS